LLKFFINHNVVYKTTKNYAVVFTKEEKRRNILFFSFVLTQKKDHEIALKIKNLVSIEAVLRYRNFLTNPNEGVET